MKQVYKERIMFEWFKQLKSIVKNYSADYAKVNRKVDEANQKVDEANQKSTYALDKAKKAQTVIREITDAHVDIRYKTPHQVVLAGRHKNMDFVQCYSIRAEDFAHLVKVLKDMEHCNIATIDHPMGMRAVIEHGFK